MLDIYRRTNSKGKRIQQLFCQLVKPESPEQGMVCRFSYCGPALTGEDIGEWCGAGCQANYSSTPCLLGRSCSPIEPTCEPNATTAIVWPSNYGNSLYTCRPYCNDTCCYIFNPKERLNFRSRPAIAGWLILGLSVLIGAFAMLPICQKLYADWYLKEELKAAAAYNLKYVKVDMDGGPIAEEGTLVCTPFDGRTLVRPDRFAIRDTCRKGRKKIRKCAIALVGLGAAIAIACLLYGTPGLHGGGSGLSLTIVLVPFCIYTWITSALAYFLVIYHFGWDRRCEYDISTGVSGSIAVLVLMCLMPIIGGYDGISGIAFSDVPPDQQTLITNQARYTSLVSASNAIFSIAVGILLYAQTNIIFGLLT